MGTVARQQTLYKENGWLKNPPNHRDAQKPKGFFLTQSAANKLWQLFFNKRISFFIEFFKLRKKLLKAKLVALKAAIIQSLIPILSMIKNYYCKIHVAQIPIVSFQRTLLLASLISSFFPQTHHLKNPYLTCPLPTSKQETKYFSSQSILATVICMPFKCKAKSKMRKTWKKESY